MARLREAAAEQPVESGAAWNARQLEVAIKTKIAVTVTVRMPDGREVAYVLEPAGLAGGRLRARDRKADIERTLPLSSIVAVAPLVPETYLGRLPRASRPQSTLRSARGAAPG